ncbi:metal-dependent hydrolase [Aspergillus flavus]|uniref:Metal-dependent hydrolase n=1 Tax=Aspergillus flavus TaxID=5059 RepID=A0A3M7JMI3_ASPFL|nr:metal-dependent hydrolase [Aspergillus flavus]KAJ1716691.1 amidohydrolase family protein [Aspergillus flavus]KOC14431.1 hypothetical protein AFLA70_270g001800 [Aspergillus flavus AF70]RMZ37946.1 hypothetical protein CA14_004764 [Aspergillus flavus]
MASVHFMLATRNGGLALRRPDLGVIAKGAKADIVVWDGMSPGMLGWDDPVAAVILHSNVGDIKHVLVDGKFVQRDRKLTVENYSSIQQRFPVTARKVQAEWKKRPYPVLEGKYSLFDYRYEQVPYVDTVRGDGNGYGNQYL